MRRTLCKCSICRNRQYDGVHIYSSTPECAERGPCPARFPKDVIENKGGHRIFWHDGKPLEREKDLQIHYRLVWFGTPSDVTTEANDGRGPVDFKISRGRPDKTLVEMKLAKNSKLERNLKRQVPIYQAASDAKRAIKAINVERPAAEACFK
jgi:hypothetical protein